MKYVKLLTPIAALLLITSIEGEELKSQRGSTALSDQGTTSPSDLTGRSAAGLSAKESQDARIAGPTYLINSTLGVARVYAKVWLEGAYDVTANRMIRTAGYKAILDTLKRDWPTRFLTSNVAAPITTVIPNALDFVLVYLRNAESGGAPAASNIGILGTDGFLYDLNGDPGVSMNIRNGNYYIILLHRNHIGVQSKSAVNTMTLTGYNQGQYFDFSNIVNCYHSTGWVNNEPVKLLEANVYGLYAGNTHSYIGMEPGAGGFASTLPKVIYSLDGVPIQQENGNDPKYSRADCNLNGVVVYALDFILSQNNSSVATEIPMPLIP